MPVLVNNAPRVGIRARHADANSLSGAAPLGQSAAENNKHSD